MHLAGLDLNLLVVLDALFTEQNVTRAGQRIHLSQSATSAALGRLRQFFADELLVPVGHRMMLTPKARELQESVRDVILRADALTRNKTTFNPATTSRNFKIMMSDYPATVFLPAALARISHAAPGITFDILGLPELPAEKLERGDVDLLMMPKQFISPRHPSEELFQDGHVCVVWSDNKLVGKRVTLRQYLSMGHVGVRFPGQPLPVLDEWLGAEFGQERRLEVTASAFNLMAPMVVGTNRIATMHKWLARDCARSLPVRIVAPPAELPPVIETLQWHKYRDLDPGIIWIRNVLKASVPVARRHTRHLSMP